MDCTQHITRSLDHTITSEGGAQVQMDTRGGLRLEKRALVTLVPMLTLLPAPLQLLAVVVQALQAHDAIMKAHPGQIQSARVKTKWAEKPPEAGQEFTCGNCPPS